MFSPSEDQSRVPRQWRAALRNAAELVVAFATLDSYPASRAPHDSVDVADAPAFDRCEGRRSAEHAPVDASHSGRRTPRPDPHGRGSRITRTGTRRGHGTPAPAPAICLHRARVEVPAQTASGEPSMPSASA